jgi:hypothetical protein
MSVPVQTRKPRFSVRLLDAAARRAAGGGAPRLRPRGRLEPRVAGGECLPAHRPRVRLSPSLSPGGSTAFTAVSVFAS